MVGCGALVGAAPASSVTGGTVIYSSQDLKGAQLGVDLADVSCVSSGNCIAVGAAASSPLGALVETLSGGTWVQTILNDQGLNSSYLSGVWCASMTSCIAAGGQGPLGGDVTGDTPLVETLSNGTWSADTDGLAPSDAVNAYFNAVSCVSITSCVAAGYYSDSSGDDHVLIDELSGSTWTLMATSDPVGSTFAQVASLQCFSPTSCVAVGSWGNSSSSSNGLVETLSGSTWTTTTLPGVEQLRSVSCASSTSCLAVGYEVTGTAITDLVNVTETLSGGTWT